MKYILETERLLLREFNVSDAQKMFDLNSDFDVIKYTGDVAFESVESTKNFIENYPDYKKNGFGRLACIEKTSNEFIGWCGLKKHPNDEVDIGYRFFKKDWGKGFATESSRANLEYGFNILNLDEIIGRSDPKNKASINIFKKLNMKFWKTESVDHIEDAVIYRITKEEFSEL